ncbi:hypothetical protein IFO69_11725 [Echinicola sp. CAU 1574]|uniref:HPt domain-containing protein n=1 Tax=Echinicola arenosa TaxID=2774144 RepID=A0ABR9AKU4_9BACT|nr:hypothetical protein [Echinicola arenosa]MBD8489413.1 hypothetical protein [Echinicola arenosa]
MNNGATYMVSSRNINMEKVQEMSEGDLAFQKELLLAISNSVSELKERYREAIDRKDEELIHQARHKVRPTVTIFELRNLSEVLEDGRKLIAAAGMDANFDNHFQEFLKATDNLLRDIEEGDLGIN